jgi:hypothetical protein
MHRARETHESLRVLAARKGFGSVSRCPSGCYHISLPNLSFRVTLAQYRALLEMLADAEEPLPSRVVAH